MREHQYSSMVSDSLATLLCIEANSKQLNTSETRSDLPRVKISTK